MEKLHFPRVTPNVLQDSCSSHRIENFSDSKYIRFSITKCLGCFQILDKFH